MNQKEIANIASKCFGLYFIVIGVVNLKQLVIMGLPSLYRDYEESTIFYLGLVLLDACFYFLAAWVLIKKSDWVAGRLTKDGGDVNINIPKADLIEIVIIGICISVIVYALPEILNKLSRYLYFNEFSKNERNQFWDGKNQRAEIIYSVFKLAISLMVITNARWISKRLGTIGTKDDEFDRK